MDMPKKLIIDLEGVNGIPGLPLISEEGEKIVIAGKSIISIPENEQNHKVYKLLEENFNLVFCTTQTLEDFDFYPIPKLAIFAVDRQGNCFGTIGGIGDIDDNNYSIGCVDCKGICSKIADSLKDFLQLVIFYPFWRDVIQCERMGLSYDTRVMEQKYTEMTSQNLAHQCEIATILNIRKNPKSIELLLSNIKCTSELTAYHSKEEAQKANTFYEIHLSR